MRRRNLSLAAGPFLLFTLFGFLVGGFSPVASQQIGGLMVFGSSSQAELTNANGWGFFAAAPIAEWLQARISFDKVSQDSRTEGLVCFRYAPNLGCRYEDIEATQTLGSVRVSFLPRFTFRNVLQLGAGGGVSFNQVRGEALGTTTGREANLDAPKTGQLGYLTMASLAFTPVETVPVTVVGLATSHWVDFRNCVSYDEVYDPYCGVSRFQEFSLGLAWKF